MLDWWGLRFGDEGGLLEIGAGRGGGNYTR